MTPELRRIIAMNVSNRRRRSEKRAAEPQPFSLDDEQIRLVMSIAASLPVEKRDTFLQRVAGHFTMLGISKPTSHQLDTAYRVGLQNLLHGDGTAA
jgi:hypothetical protein